MLGRELSRTLKDGNSIVGVDSVELADKSVMLDAFYQESINDLESIKKIFAKERPDVAIHAAAWTDVDGCELNPERARKVNVEGTLNLVKVSGEVPTPLVFISTDFVFDGSKKEPYIETDKCAPLGVYAETKWEGENAIRKFLSDYAIVRTSWLFGAGGKNFVNSIISKSAKEKELKVVNDQTGSPTYTKDLSKAIRELLEVGIKGAEIYHVSNSGQCSWHEFALGIKSCVPEMKDVSVEPVSSNDFGSQALRPIFSVMDTSKFQKRTGMTMRNWKEALSEYIQEYSHSERVGADREA